MRLSPSAELERPSAAPAERLAWLSGVTYAHRGLHGTGAVENSPSAFRAAIAAGLGIECDVQLSADGQAMVFHDWELERLTASVGPVRARTARELAALTLKGSTDPIPALPDLLAEIRGEVPLLIEIKSRRELAFEALCEAVRDALASYAGQAAVMSFDPRVVGWFARNEPGVVRGLVVSEEDARGLLGDLRREATAWHARPEFLAYDVRNLPSRFAAGQRRRGLPLLTWTVRTPELLERARAHADAAIAEAAGLTDLAPASAAGG